MPDAKLKTELKKIIPPHQETTYLRAASYMIAFVIIGGLIYSFFSHAATPWVVKETEGGNPSGMATIQNSTNASGGKYVQFGTNISSSSCTPADPNADLAAKNLLNLLCNIRGNSEPKILSGQQIENSSYGLSDLSSIKTQTGKTPAVIGYDLLYDYTGGPATCNPASPRTGDNWQDIANDATTRGEAGSIPELVFVMDDPLTGCGYNDVSGTGTSSPSPLLTPGTRANNTLNAYLNYVDDVGLQLQSHNIPLLYRIFPEMDGNWFWWGKLSWFKQLWQYTYNYITSHGVHNFLYVYASTASADATDYPGNNYVDVVGTDTYIPDTQMGNGQWITDQQAYNSIAPGKPFAVTEVGYNPSCSPNNTFNNALLLNGLLQTGSDAPGPAYFLGWAHPCGIAFQNNLPSVYDSPFVASQGDYPKP